MHAAPGILRKAFGIECQAVGGTAELSKIEIEYSFAVVVSLRLANRLIEPFPGLQWIEKLVTREFLEAKATRPHTHAGLNAMIDSRSSIKVLQRDCGFETFG